jgi:hypothetical protein
MSTRDDTHEGHVMAADLAPLADGTLHASAVATHVAGCPECRARVDALRGQRAALARLVASGDAGAGGDAWRLAARAAGRRTAADLLAELARACLARSEPEARRAALGDLPRPMERIVADLSLLRARMESLDETLPIVGLPNLDDLSRRPHGTAVLARACLDALEAIEGRSARHEALRARAR